MIFAGVTRSHQARQPKPEPAGGVQALDDAEKSETFFLAGRPHSGQGTSCG